MSVHSASVPALDQIWSWLDEVPDPEIPVISVVELGIVRDLEWLAGSEESEPELRVAITPTYSGCPATDVIAGDIEHALRSNGIVKLRLENQLTPPWTTDWITASGRQKLKVYGIAPPAERADASLRLAGTRPTPPVIGCPRCGSTSTSKISEFGSTPCKAQYRCRDCLEPFDYFKCL
jgi:ring-1,2-phenylacetyl-CoA epoxidase subunit PaaD